MIFELCPSLAEASQEPDEISITWAAVGRADDILTMTTELHTEPYPPNIVTAYRSGQDWIEDEDAEEHLMIRYHSFVDWLSPRIILESETREGGDESILQYTAELVDHHHENEKIEGICHIFR
jgi:hypothetical protein